MLVEIVNCSQSWNSKMRQDSSKRIVICGNMSHYDKMLECQTFLRKNNIGSIVPHEEKEFVKSLTPEDFIEFKRKVSIAYFKKIREKDILGILVVNETKRGIKNYIGTNTFAEIAVAVT